MPFKSVTRRVFIASPSDLNEERLAVTQAIHGWNERHAEAEATTLLPVKWETCLFPQIAPRPQKAINDQLVEPCDILLGLFWTRLGTNTGVAASGTVEEIDLVAAAGKPCLLYFSDRKVAPSGINTDQLAALRDFKKLTYERAVTGSFCDIDEIKRKVEYDLLKLVRSIRAAGRISVAPVQPLIGAIQIHHVSLAVSNLKESIHFYRDILGLEEIPRAPFAFDGAWLRLPCGQELHLIERDPTQTPSHYRLNHFAIRVSKLNHAFDWLRGQWHGVEDCSTLPTAYPQLYVRDPDGNVVEINSAETITCQKDRKNEIKLRV